MAEPPVPPMPPVSPVPPARVRLSPAVLVIAAALLVELMAFAGRYGYHRDEMYFIVAGNHPAFGYPDQPALVPLITAAMHDIAASLYLLRLPSALAAAATALVAGLIAREAGGGTRAQVIAAGATAVGAISLATGHFVTTTTFDVLSTTVLGWLLVRATIRHDPPALLWAGVAAGLGFEAKPQVAFVAAVALVSLALVGPRWVFRSRYLYAGLGVAVLLALPYLVWQQRHDWPQLTVAGNVAGDAEGGRIGFLPFQLVMVSPPLLPVWIAGLVAAARNPALRPLRFLPVLYGLVTVIYLAADGKAYYLASVYPILLGIGAIPTAAWTLRGSRRLREALVAAAVVLSAIVSGFVALPVLPARQLQGSVVMALNPDTGETVGWPDFVDTVAGVWNGLPASTRDHAVIVTRNYGEAAAIDLLGGEDGLPHAYSGHNGFSLWDRPRDDQTTVVVVGYGLPDTVEPYFTGCQVVAVVHNSAGLDNDEDGGHVLTCTGLTAPWRELWPELRHYN